MDDMWKRLLTVLALSMVLPWLMLFFGSKNSGTVRNPDPTASSRPVPDTTATWAKPAGAVTVPVLQSEQLLVQMDLEEYVRGVVLAEMPASFDPEALKAQAVVARTYALRRVTLGDKHPQGAVCTDPGCCQAWISDEAYLESMGNGADVAKTAAAVEMTAGLVVTWQGALAETTYFSCSGGRTESALAVWNSEIPYLQSVESPGEQWAPVFSSELIFSAEEFAACLGRTLSGSPADWFGAEERTAGGGVATLVIGGITYSGVELRSLLGLPSTAFSMAAAGESVTVTAAGHGHRVGLSQYGAGAMADDGNDFAAILAHYYPGTEIDKITDIR